MLVICIYYIVKNFIKYMYIQYQYLMIKKISGCTRYITWQIHVWRIVINYFCWIILFHILIILHYFVLFLWLSGLTVFPGSLDSMVTRAEYIMSGVPSKNFPHPPTNRVSPEITRNAYIIGTKHMYINIFLTN